MVDFVLLSLALAAGAAAFFNPCGFAVLPAYISNYFSKSQKKSSPAKSLFSGVSVGVIATLGFIFLFVILGMLLKFVSRDIGNYIPWIDFVLGLVLIGFGLLLIVGRGFGFTVPVRSLPLENNFSFFQYGIVYGLASLGCTLPIFLSVAFGSLAATFVEGIFMFFAYAIGMSLPFIAVTIATVLSKDIFVSKLQSYLKYMKTINAIILIFVGLYLIYFQLNAGLLVRV